ncbi:MAG: Addiction module component, CHP02574 [Planctomycetaceae bacterium]|nr:Addiction module component, CHP02574 [Planctomycetaceae bacterium]
MSTDINHLRNLPVADKLLIVEQLWDDIHDSDEPLVLRDWHLEEAKRRAIDLDANPASALTRDELWKLVDGSDG